MKRGMKEEKPNDDRLNIGLRIWIRDWWYKIHESGATEARRAELDRKFRDEIKYAIEKGADEERRRISTEVRKIYPFGGYEDVIKKVLYIINNQ